MVGTLEDALASKKKDDGDILEPWRRAVVGNSARIDLPMDDRFILRQIAPMMAGLAEHIAFTTRRTDLTEYQILLSIRHEISALNRFIREKHGGALKNGTFPREPSKEELATEEKLAQYLAKEKARK